MFRCTIISFFLHGLLIASFLLLSLVAPPHPTQKITEIAFTFSGGNPKKKPGAPPPSPVENPEPAATPAPTAAPTPAKKADAAPTPAPKMTPAPTPRPASPTPRLTPVPPQPTKPPIIQPPRKTPVPTPPATPVKTPVATVKTPPKIKAAPTRNIIIPPRKQDDLIVLAHPTPTPKTTPAPAVPDVQVAAVQEPAVPAATEFPGNTPAVAATPPTPAAGAGGKGTAFKTNPGSAISSLVVPDGENGGNAGSGPAGTGSLLNSLSQTYFMIVLQRIEENFKLANAYPGVTCQVQFTIQKDGTINEIKLLKKTGYENLDALAVQALNMTKLPALYDGMQRTSLPVILTFDFAKKEF